MPQTGSQRTTNAQRQVARYVGGTMSLAQMQAQIEAVITKAISAEQRSQFRFDNLYIRSYWPFQLALKGKAFVLLFHAQTNGRIAWMLTLAIKGKGYPSLSANPEQIDEMSLFAAMADALSKHRSFERIEHVVEL